MTKKINHQNSEDVKSIPEMAENAMKSKKVFEQVVSSLSCASRIDRQQAAETIYFIAQKKPEKLFQSIPEMIDALNRPESQTRWESLRALAILAKIEPKACEQAFESAEIALFDEESGILRLSAFQFFSSLGSVNALLSKRCWVLLSEAIQCYHGEVEYDDMLDALLQFTNGKIDKSVKQDIKEIFAFDLENSKGSTHQKTLAIIGNLNKK